MANILIFSNQLLQKIGTNPLFEDIEANTSQNFINSLPNWYRNNTVKDKAVFIDLCITLYKSNNGNYNTHSFNVILEYLKIANAKEVINIIDNISKLYTVNEEAKINGVIKSRYTTQVNFCKEIYSYLSDEKKSEIDTFLISHPNYYQRFFDHIDEIDVKKIPNKEILADGIIVACRTQNNINIKEKFYNIIEEFELDKFSDTIIQYKQEVESNLKQQSIIHVQELSYKLLKSSKYFDLKTKIEIAEHCLTIIENSFNPNNQIYLYKFVLDMYFDLDNEYQNRVLNYIFNTRIGKSQDIRIIANDFNELYKIKNTKHKNAIKFSLSQREENFESLKPLIQNNPNGIRNIVIEGYNKLVLGEKNYKKKKEFDLWLEQFDEKQTL